MEWFIAVVVVAALGVAAVAAAGGLGEMAKEPVRDVYRQDLPERPLGAADIQRLKFGITLRGYAMAQVDDVLDRLAAEIAERDELIARLTADDPSEKAGPAAVGQPAVAADIAPHEVPPDDGTGASSGPAETFRAPVETDGHHAEHSVVAEPERS